MTADVAIKALAVAVTLIGLLIGAFQFLQVQAIQAAKPYLEKKLEWCAEAVETTARISSTPEPDQKALLRFWQMYWGVMGLIENQAVTAAMVDFGGLLREGGSQEGGAKDPGGPVEGLQGASLRLAHACRDELSREWSAKWARRN